MQSSKTYTVQEAKVALERYCVYQERTHQEAASKLVKMGMITEAREVVLLHLYQHDFINETRFAKVYAGGKFRINKWGRLKIKKGLLQKGVSTANINEGLAEIDTEEYSSVLQELATKKQQLIKAKNPYEKKQKLTRYLQQKGYEMNLIYELDILKN